MRHPVALLSIVALLAACSGASESNWNPLNWFGKTTEERVAAVNAPARQDGRKPINEIVRLQIDATPGGAILKVTGLPERQAFYNAELVPLADEKPVDGVLEYEFRISAPIGATQSGPPQSREVVVARFLSEQTLRGVRTIRVKGATNALVTRR